MSTEITKAPQTGVAQRDPFVDALVRDAMAHAVSAVTADQLSGALLAAFRKNPGLAKCDPASLVTSLQICAQLGLKPNTPLGHVYLIPYGSTCTPILGYKGYQELARRHPSVRSVFAEVVFTGEHFALSAGSDGMRVEHHPDPARSSIDADWKATRDRIVGAYAVCHLANGERMTRWISAADIDARRIRGASGKGKRTPWDTDYAAMARKSAVRALFGSGEAPMSDEIAQALEVDDTYDRAEIETARASTGPGVATVGYDEVPASPQIEAAPPLPPKVEAMRARLEANGWLHAAIAHLGEPAGWNLADVAAWGKARREEIEAAAAKVAAFGESGGEE
jgi:recombination protein RecT